MGSDLVSAVLRGVIAFVITFVVVALLGAIFDETGLVEVGNALERFGWLLAIAVGVLVGWTHYDRRLHI